MNREFGMFSDGAVTRTPGKHFFTANKTHSTLNDYPHISEETNTIRHQTSNINTHFKIFSHTYKIHHCSTYIYKYIYIYIYVYIYIYTQSIIFLIALQFD